MKHLLFAINQLVFAVSASAEAPQVEGFEVVRVGIYTSDVTSTERDANGVLQNVIANSRLALNTTTIPAKLGVSFGFEFKITGQPDGAVVTIRKETHYPEPGAMPPGATKPLLVNSKMTNRALNEVSFSSYRLEESWELMPGKWAFEFWLGDRKLGEQEFTLVTQ